MKKARAERAILVSISGSGETLPSAVEAACRRVEAQPSLADTPITWSVPHDRNGNSTVETLTIRDIDEIISCGTDWAPHGILTDAELVTHFSESPRSRTKARQSQPEQASRRLTVFPWPDVFSRYEKLAERIGAGNREYWSCLRDADRSVIVQIPDGRCLRAVRISGISADLEPFVARKVSKNLLRRLQTLGRKYEAVVLHVASSLEPTREEMESAIDFLAEVVEKSSSRFEPRLLSDVTGRAAKAPITDRGPWAPLEPALYAAAHATAVRRAAGSRRKGRARRGGTGALQPNTAERTNRDNRTFIANMQGSAVLSTGSIDIRFLDGMITGVGIGRDDYIVNSPAESYLTYGGRKRKFKTVSAFSFEGECSRGLYVNSRVTGNGISDDGRLELDCVLLDDIECVILDAEITLPRWTSASSIAGARFSELTIARLARDDEVAVTRTLPDGSTFGFTAKCGDTFSAVAPASQISIHHAGKTLSFACLGPAESTFPFVINARRKSGVTEVTLVLFGCFDGVATTRLSGFRHRAIHAVKLGDFSPEELAAARSAIDNRITASGVPPLET